MCNKMDDAFTNRLTLAISSTFSLERSQRRKENYPARCFSRDLPRCSTLIIIIIYLCSVISPRCGREITFVFLRESKYGKRFTVPRSSRTTGERIFKRIIVYFFFFFFFFIFFVLIVRAELCQSQLHIAQRPIKRGAFISKS